MERYRKSNLLNGDIEFFALNAVVVLGPIIHLKKRSRLGIGVLSVNSIWIGIKELNSLMATGERRLDCLLIRNSRLLRG